MEVGDVVAGQGGVRAPADDAGPVRREVLLGDAPHVLLAPGGPRRRGRGTVDGVGEQPGPLDGARDQVEHAVSAPESQCDPGSAHPFQLVRVSGERVEREGAAPHRVSRRNRQHPRGDGRPGDGPRAVGADDDVVPLLGVRRPDHRAARRMAQHLGDGTPSVVRDAVGVRAQGAPQQAPMAGCHRAFVTSQFTRVLPTGLPGEPDPRGHRRRLHAGVQIAGRDQFPVERRRDDDAEPPVLQGPVTALVHRDLGPGPRPGDRHGAAGHAPADHSDA